MNAGIRKLNQEANPKYSLNNLISILITSNDKNAQDTNESIKSISAFEEVRLQKQKDTNPPINPNATNDELRGYLGTILPEFDRDRVNISDIKKLIKWYAILENLDVFKKPAEGEENKVAGNKSATPLHHAPAKDMNVQQQSVAKPRMTKNKV